MQKIIKEYYKNGQVEYEIPFEIDDNRRVQHGIQKNYYQDGKLKEEIPYINGEIHGIWRGYLPDGNVRYEYVYEHHQRIKVNVQCQ